LRRKKRLLDSGRNVKRKLPFVKSRKPRPRQKRLLKPRNVKRRNANLTKRRSERKTKRSERRRKRRRKPASNQP
jgi:hypothetical protein